VTKKTVNQFTNSISLRTRLLAVKTARLSDALGKSGAMDHDMKCVSANCRMAGPAFTLRVHPADILMVAKAVALCPQGKVLVIDGQGELNTALLGNIVTLEARLKKVAGFVVDGAIRDSSEIRRDRLPVFARSVVPNAGGTEYIGELELPVQCGGVVVTSGDWVIGDEDGVVVVPADRLLSVLKLAEQLATVEKKIERGVRQGKTLVSLLHYDEVFDRKSKGVRLPQMNFRGR
jgi:RraA family protein